MILNGDALEMLRTLPGESVQCCITSPPYYGLRDYCVSGQIGLEETPDAYISRLVDVFREVRRVLRNDGTLWLNIGDSYGHGTGASRKQSTNPGVGANSPDAQNSVGRNGNAAKQLIGIPWMLAFALRADGWFLRQDIIWAKNNPMPESVRDRCTKSHEYIFLLSKSKTYYYDADAIAEPVTDSTVSRLSQPGIDQQEGSARVPGKTNGNMKAVGRGGANAFRGQGSNRDSETGPANRAGRDMRNVGAPRFGGSKYGDDASEQSRTKSGNEYVLQPTRNARSVWTINTRPYKEAHFATFPPEIPRRCIAAGTKEGDTVLDPFGGSGTTGEVAQRMGRKCILIELNPEYVKLIEKRLSGAHPLFGGEQ